MDSAESASASSTTTTYESPRSSTATMDTTKIQPTLESKDSGADNGLLTASIDQLQSPNYRQVLDVVAQLRLCGLGSILQLPQIVVCGNQSSGKSSVLEAITQVPFPRKENMCTRFATEIVMRRDPQKSITTKIIPDKSRSEEEQQYLLEFNEVITNFSQLPSLIDRATEWMGLGDTRAFSRDVLSVELAGPERPQLTLVDLPGLILAPNKRQTEEDVKLIHDLVNDYISEKRTIMLAVISAKDDFANQGILPKCQAVDHDGQRTLGIISKPDYLKNGSSNQTSWINLAENKNIFFRLGWHILKNRGEDEMDITFESRDASEASFFSRGAYRKLPQSSKGIAALRSRLSQLLYSHLKSELPNLRRELDSKHTQTMEDLERLGEKRSSASEQRRFLMRISRDYQNIVQSAVEGHYERDFFVAIDTSEDPYHATNMRRLRAAVQHLNLQFASQMRQFGHKHRIPATKDAAGTNDDHDLPEPELSDYYAEGEQYQIDLERLDALEWVKKLLVRSRGRELPGNFNPLLMNSLFQEQSENWERFAQEHIARIDALCHDFVCEAVGFVTDSDIAERLRSLKLDTALKRRCSDATQELDRLIKDKKRPPMTYDPQYTAAIREARSKKSAAKYQALADSAKVDIITTSGVRHKYLNPDVMKDGIREVLDPDMDKNSAEDALDSQLAYYKDKVRYFIAAVTEQVIERHLLHDLGEHTFSPMVVVDLADEEVAYIAAEAEDISRKREDLKGQMQILENGQEAFRRALGAYR